MANKLRDEDLNLNIIVNGDKGKKELGDLEKSTRELTARNKELRAEKDKLVRAGKKETDEYKKVNAEIRDNNRTIKANEARMTELRKSIGLTGLTMRQLRTEQTRLKRLMDSSTPGTAQWLKYRNELNRVEAQMSKVRSGSKTMQFSIGKMADGFNRYFSMITVWAASVTGILFGFKKASNSFAEFDDQVADVMKTTNLTKEEVLELDEELQKLDTRSAQEELLGLSRIAGKLGKDSVKDVEGFVRAADQVNVALNEDLGGDIEETVRKLGKINDIFGIEQAYGTEQAMLKTGSAINALGAASTANEGYIVEFTNRVAGVAPGADISIDKILGLAATLDQLAQTSEVSSTVVAQVIPDMFKDTERYARIANMSVADFTKILKSDTNEAFIRFLEGLNSNNGGLKEMVTKLDELGLEGRRSVNVLTVLGKNTEKLREQQELANIEFEKGTSLTEEFNIKNNTRQAQLEKSRKNLALITRELGQSLSPAVLVSTNAFTYFVKALVALIRITKQYYPIILSSTAAIVAYWTATKLAANWTNIHYGYLVAANAIKKAYAFTTGVLTGKIKLATVAQRAWNTAQKANPIGLIAGLLAGAAVWLVAYTKKVNALTAEQKALNDVETRAKQNIVERKTQVELLLEAAKNEKRSLDERKKALEELNRISPEYFGNLNLEKINSEEAKKATDEYTESLLKQARVAAARESLIELEKERIDALQNNTDFNTKWYQSAWNGIKSMGNAASFAYYQAETGANNAAQAEQDYIDRKNVLLGLIEKGKIPPAEQTDPAIGTRKTVGNEIFEWDGENWNKVGVVGNENLSENEIKKRLEALEASYNEEQALIRKRHLQGITTEDQYNADLLQAELQFLADKLKIYNVGSKEYQETVNKALELQVAADKKIKDALIKAEQELAAAKIDNIPDELAKQLELVKQKWAKEKTELERQLIEKETLSENEIALNDAVYKTIEEKEVAHQKRLQEIKELGEIKDLDNLVSAATPVDPNFTTPEQQQALFDARAELIEAQYEREKRLAGNNHAALLAAERNYQAAMYQLKSDQIDAEYAVVEQRIDAAQNYVAMLASVVDQESALGKALFLFNQGLAVADIWINIAKANAKAVAALIVPPAYGPVIAANTAMGAVQSGIVLSQTIAKLSKNGKKEGGFANKGSDDEIDGFYHRNEWIASAPAVRNPNVKQFIDVFEEAQRNGTIQTLNMKDIFNAINTTIPGRKSGGFANPSVSQSPTYTEAGLTESSMQYQDSIPAETLNNLTQAIEKFMQWKPKVYTQQLKKELEEIEQQQKLMGM